MLILIFFPLLHLLDVMMGPGIAAMFGVVEAAALAPLLAMVGGIRTGKLTSSCNDRRRVRDRPCCDGAVPAYSVERPLPLNFSAQYDIDEGKAALFASARPGACPRPSRTSSPWATFPRRSAVLQVLLHARCRLRLRRPQARR